MFNSHECKLSPFNPTNFENRYFSRHLMYACDVFEKLALRTWSGSQAYGNSFTWRLKMTITQAKISI